MKNTLTYSIPFSFKGQQFAPTCTLDLDACMVATAGLPCLYQHLANTNKISVYSHEYDVMMMGDLNVVSAQGYAAEYFNDEGLDTEGFKSRWLAEQLHQMMADIALQQMGVTHLDAVKGLKEALLAAYQLGRSSPE
jgi:hypothetical protein